jgi:hypothetical protein
MEECNELGIQLLMINEDEWNERPNIIKNKILNLCGLSEKGSGARKLIVKQIPNSEARQFLEIFHIQGKPTCSLSIGAFECDKLVSVMTFFPQRGTNMMELNRFATNGKIFAGIFSKMLKYSRQFISKQIVTFADLRYSNGNLYEKTGFKKITIIRADYRYSKRMKTYHKRSFTKNRIAKKFGIDMSNRTEKETMASLGYYRIYDCGKIKYILDN